jgi:hypothetical protein
MRRITESRLMRFAQAFSSQRFQLLKTSLTKLPQALNVSLRRWRWLKA